MNALAINNFISDNCKNRVRPMMLRDVKTEALLVFCRTALERYFIKIDEAKYTATVGDDKDTTYVYETLRGLLLNLQDSVVNVDYFIELMQSSKKSPLFRPLAKSEEPLINYYDVMAKVTRDHYETEPAFLPEFLIICVLDNWISGEERSVELYPFLKDIDFLELMSKFEENREYFAKEDECTVRGIHQLSDKITIALKNYRYKANKNRVSKNRKKK
ncbi:hypothetical protein N9A28_05315 [Sulfurimonas sp.]|nr:hypothetical protein [Sulfurimonas sp.]